VKDKKQNKNKPAESPEGIQAGPPQSESLSGDPIEKRVNFQDREIVTEMQESYLSYAMSVIVARALPDVRDGMKPVHRRILYAMHDMGLSSGGKHRKSATVVGETLGKYHPHGDTAVYDSMVRMAQDFAMRYPLVDGQGNFGSIDGDNAAAMRYTEARLTPIAEEMLKDLEKDTVDFIPNYDNTRTEPAVLPSKVPQLLLNGTLGIAVGMATSIPPHNLTEVVDATEHLIENPKATVEELFQFIKGPDFPTGGEIYNKKEIIQAYVFGKGPILNRAKADIVEEKGKFKIIISELTYQTNKSTLLEKIADLVKEKKIEGIRDIRDESDKDGIRIVIELKNDAFPQKVLNKLFKYTELQKTFHLNMLALTEGIQPQTLSLKQVLEQFIEHRKIVITRRYKFELKKTQERVHILEGLAKALKNIDKVIELIKKSKDREDAKLGLIKVFKLSEIQANAILDMRLQTLAGLERKKILDELEEKLKLIKEIEDILADPKKILKVVKNELTEIKQKFGDERKTKVHSAGVGEFAEEDLIADQEIIVTVTNTGYIKRVDPKSYKAQNRGGKGMIGIKTKEEDFVEHFFVCSSHDDLLFFSNKGKVYQTKAYEIPEATRVSRGRAIVNILGLSSEEKISAVVPLEREKKGDNGDSQSKFLAMVTKKGIIKKTEVEKFRNIRKGGIAAITLEKDDDLE
jgi:DNA gyrase subunit A